MGQKLDFKARVSDITDLLEEGWTSVAIIKKYMPEWGLTRRSIERYIVFAQDIVARRMQKRENIIEAVRADIIAKEAESWLKSNLEIEARLCAIISGKLVFDKTLKKGQETQHVKTYPTCTEVINAIDILLKLRGVYKAADAKRDDPPIFKIIVRNEEEKRLVEMNRDQP